MQILECPNCGAPLESAPTDAVVECRFCGTRLGGAARPATQKVVVDLRGLDSVGRGLRRVAPFALAVPLVFALVGLGIAGVGVFIAWKTTHGFARGVRSAVAGAARTEAMTLATLATLDARGRRPLSLAAPPAGYAAFDAVANLPWALNVAQAWRRDATLDRIDVDRLRPDGTVNAADDGDAEVMYRFVSPSRIEEYRRARDLRAGAETTYQLWVIARNGAASVQAISGKPSLPSDPSAPLTAPFPSAGPLTAVLAAARTQRGWIEKPFYSGYMIHLRDEGWVWYLSTLGRDSEPRVRALDGTRSR